MLFLHAALSMAAFRFSAADAADAEHQICDHPDDGAYYHHQGSQTTMRTSDHHGSSTVERWPVTEQLHTVERETCRADGICIEVCPQEVLELVDGVLSTISARAADCIYCGQCVAVCPTRSLRMEDMPDDEFDELSKHSFSYEDFHGFLQSRRSVRVFKDVPVDEDTIDRILRAASTAPMGIPPHSTEVLVISDREERAHLLEEVVRNYAFMDKGFASPIGRAMIRLSAGAEQYEQLKNEIIALSRHANAMYERDGTDRYTYNAPVLMLFHGNRHAMSYVENAHLVCHHAMLAALSLGLGSTIIGLVPPIVDRSKKLRERYGIPRENKVITSLVLGYPKYRYRRSIRRSLAGVKRM